VQTKPNTTASLSAGSGFHNVAFFLSVFCFFFVSLFWYEFVRGSIKIREGCKLVVGHGKDSEEELGKQCDGLMVGYLTDKQMNKKENTALT
jgi:hypothetical protein